jgi:nonribosomal peptide synthetase DhbF
MASGNWQEGVDQVENRPVDECLSGLFEAQVDRTPDGTAFVFGRSRFSYAELDASANRVARLLVARGIGPESIVGLLLPRSPELLIALLGIVKAGAAYLPMDPDYPPARLLWMLEDSRASQIVTTTDLCQLLQIAEPARYLLIDQPVVQQELESLPSHRVTDPERVRAPEPRNLLYVIYTSGSTGRPKGVAVEHRNFTSLMRVMASRVKMRQDETFLALTTICFDLAGLEMFLPLLQGASLEMLNGADSRNPAQVVEKVMRSRIDIVAGVPTFWRALLACRMPRTVRVLIGGEPLSAEMVPQLLQFPEAINLYGPTETAVCSSLHYIGPKDANAGAVVTVGRALDGEEFYILDENLSPVSGGVAGELYITGAGVARGYLNQTGLTKERFLQCPFGSPGRRMYRIGDLARWREDGNVEFLGRADQQVKIRGCRVEPGEIETTLLRLVPTVKECAVVPREILGQVQLIAYCVNAPGLSVPDTRQLKMLLAKHLPDHMIPSAFVPLDKMPHTLNGKLDRQALPRPDEGTNQRLFRSPVGAMETTICKVFRETTGARQVGRDDNFFQIGGHSLAAVLCVHHLRHEFDGKVTLQQLFDAPTPEALAKSLSNGRTDKAVQVRSPELAYPTIFLVPGMGGDEPRLVRFRMEWEGVAQILALEYPDWTQLLDREGGMEVLVQQFFRQIQEVSADGPVWLLGYSIGGNCAHALALRLTKARRQVAFLGLLDAEAEPSFSVALSAQLQNGATLIQEVRHALHDVGRVIRAILQKNLTRAIALAVVRRLTSLRARPVLLIAARHRYARLPVRFGYYLHSYFNEARQLAAAASWCRAVREAPVPLSIPAFLFRSDAHAADAPPDLGWERHLPRIKIVHVQGKHETMFDPAHVKTLSCQVRSAIDTVYRRQLKLTLRPGSDGTAPGLSRTQNNARPYRVIGRDDFPDSVRVTGDAIDRAKERAIACVWLPNA